MLRALADGETRPLALAALADQRLRATSAAVVRRTRRLQGTQPSLSPASEDDLGTVAINRTAEGPIGPRDCEAAGPVSGCGAAAGRGARSGRGFGTSDHRRSGRRSSDISFRETPRLVGWSMPRTRRE